jgi:hypothetical protein
MSVYSSTSPPIAISTPIVRRTAVLVPKETHEPTPPWFFVSGFFPVSFFVACQRNTSFGTSPMRQASVALALANGNWRTTADTSAGLSHQPKSQAVLSPWKIGVPPTFRKSNASAIT